MTCLEAPGPVSPGVPRCPPMSQGTVRSGRDNVLPPPLEEHRWPRAACQTLPVGAVRLGKPYCSHSPFGEPNKVFTPTRPSHSLTHLAFVAADVIRYTPGRPSLPLASRTRGRAAPTVTNCSPSEGLGAIYVTLNWAYEAKKCIDFEFTWSIAPRAFDACRSAVDRAIF